MEPIAAQNHPIAVRPAGGTQGTELSSLLRDGRVLAGEVLQSMADGGVLLGIGRQRVPAQTHLRLDPGQHFLFQVQETADQVLLRILSAPSGEDSDFLRFLRAVIGQDRPLGELLGDLAARVRAELERPGAELEALRRLLGQLDAHALRPGDGAAELRGLLAAAGGRYEAALLAAALGGRAGEWAARLGQNLKSQLLRALADLPEGPVKEAVARALAGIEAEQLLNLARAHSGEAQVLSFPLHDAGGWATAHLLLAPPRRREEEGGDGEAAEGDEEQQRFVLGVELSALGPVRADLMLSDEALTLRLLVTRPEVAERLRADLPELVRRLGDGRRSVRVVTALGTPEEATVTAGPADVALLRQHRIMDVRG